MVKRGKRARRWGRLAFFLPVIAVLAIVAFALLSNQGGQAGTLIVEAQSSSRYYPAVMLSATATVSSSKGTTPFNVSLTAGQHQVTYSSITGYYTPSPRTVTVEGGKTGYSIGVYDPIPKMISITPSGFNQTTISALHGITPVFWVNRSGTYQILQLQPVGKVELQAGQNFTYVFQQAGSFAFSLILSNASGSVQVT
jgi:hypothetical protein